MMYAVHSRRDDYGIENAFEPDRQAPVGMMKQRRAFEGDKETQQRNWSDAKDEDSDREKSGRENHLAKVKTRRRAYVHVQVGVMNVVKSPEQRNHVVRPMPPPIGIIHKQKCRDDPGPTRKRDPAKQTEMSTLHPRGQHQRHGQSCPP